MNQKGFINIILVIIIVALAGVGAYFILNQQTTPPIFIPTPTPIPSPTPTPTPSPTPTPIACTMEAKQCPDGSYVGRTGPKCEFAECPAITPAPNAEKITRKVGEQESSFLIQKINPNSVEGLWYQAYPVAREEGTPKTLYIGDDIGYVCEGISEKLTGINYSGQTVTFTKVVGERPYGGCPICLAGNTLIDTPSGGVAVKDLQVGMPIWTTDKAGYRISGIVIKTSKVPVPPTHQMVHLVLDDGRELLVSPGHPTTDGRSVGDLTFGNLYDGASIIGTQRVPYGEGATYDVLPSGETGFYWANGVLLGSTLRSE